jgi:MinD-like ATPase involved in chromosome partitioning or flagellar assembly
LSKIISIHSFRGGTGKSNTTANLAAQLAVTGLRVGVVDTDILSPGIHVLFGLQEGGLSFSLNDYLWGRCSIQDAAYDVTPAVGESLPGRIYLIPSSLKAGEIARILREGYDVGLLNDGFRTLLDKLQLDVLLIDTHPGLNEETLLSIAISDALLIILRPDQQDYLGTGVTVEVARRLEVPQMLMIVNKTPQAFDLQEVRARVERAYDCEVAAVLPHSDRMMALASGGIFSLRYPDHPLSASLRQVAARLEPAGGSG